MSDSFSFFEILKQILWEVPGLLVVIVGMLFITMRTMSKRTKSAAMVGLLLLLLDGLFGIFFRILPMLGSGPADWVYSIFDFISIICSVGGVVGLIIAVCSIDKADSEKTEADNPYQNA